MLARARPDDHRPRRRLAGPRRASCAPPTARSARPPSCRWRPRRRSRGCCRPRSRPSATTWSSATPSTCSSTPATSCIARFGGLHEFMGWRGPIVTDSGGFQVFSMGHGTVADEIKGRAPHGGRPPGRDPRHRGGGRALPLLPRRLRALHGARDLDGDPGRARLGPRARLRRVHAVQRRRATTPRARPSARTAGCDRCLDWHARARPRRASSSTASSRAASSRTCASSRRRRSPPASATASRSAARSAPTRPRCTRSSTGRRPRCRRTRPRHLLGIGEIDDLVRGRRARHRHLRLRDADAPRPPRHGARPRPRAPLARRPQPGALARTPTSR